MLLKKLLVIFLLMVYGLSSSGMTIQFHYCCGKLKSIHLSPVTEKQCGMKHSMFSKPCCNDKQVQFQLKGDQKSEQAKCILFVPGPIEKAEVFLNFRPSVSKIIIPEIFAPPPVAKQLHKFYCVYRI